MGHERDLESDLQSAILSVRQEDDDLAIDEISEYLLSEDQINRYLIGLQDECTRASFYCTTTRSIAYKPVAGESPSKLVDTVPGIVDRAQLRDWIVSQEWSWIHPRYRWLLEGE
ncbi:hypothetical protein [Natronorubrum daqingense]|uniref:Uncharacterized protein n=1 Tax=Natronorubrum daqingense TaxID=588898 RepID=A0A1N6XT18_9EURY|nr:hypothetical protein [Natronorubrum daqingense]APX95868.1 hypothetical protein BB347_04135 [Natronorubrum daqingense]SIR05457.1 hypothetical protein SAMN05421809_0211 [Natronorubrum daqingense]